MISIEHLQAYSRFWSYLAGQMFFLKTDFRDKNERMQIDNQKKRGGMMRKEYEKES